MLKYSAIRLDKRKLSNVTYARNEEKKMKISGIPLHSTRVDVPFDEGHIFTIIQQTPTMKLCEGCCKQKKGMLISIIKIGHNYNNSYGR